MSEPTRDVSRCAICGWTMEGERAGCRPGYCLQRPFPDRYYDPERAAREYGPSLPRERNPYIGSPEWKTQQQVAALTEALAEAQRKLAAANGAVDFHTTRAEQAEAKLTAAQADSTALREALAAAINAMDVAASCLGDAVTVEELRLASRKAMKAFLASGQPPTGGQR